MDSKISLARYIRLRREALGKSQQALADELYYTQQAISRFESIAETFPYANLDAICRALDCSPDDLYTRNLNDPRYSALAIGEGELGETLKRMREKENLSQKEFAERLGVTERSLRNYESGATLPSWKVVEALCDAFGLLPSGLVDKEKPAPIPPAPTKKKPILWGAVALSILLAASTATVPILLTMRSGTRNYAGNGATVSDSVDESETAPAMTIISYSVEEGEPALMAAQCERTAFTALGQTSVIRIYDPTSRMDLSSEYISLNVINMSGDGADFSYSVVEGEEQGTFIFTLNSAAPGTMWCFGASVSSKGAFDPFGYGRYNPGEAVSVPSGPDKLYFVKEAKLLCNGSSEVHAEDGGAAFDVTNEVTFANGVKGVLGQTFESNMWGSSYLPLQNRSLGNATYESVLEWAADPENGHTLWRAHSRGYARSAIVTQSMLARYNDKEYEYFFAPLTVFIDPPAGE